MKKNLLLLISAVLGIAYSIYLISYFSGAMSGSTGAEAAGAVIATALVTPHMILVLLAAIFNWVAWFTNRAGFALVTGILYAVGGVLFLGYIWFVLPSMILSFIGYAQVKSQKR